MGLALFPDVPRTAGSAPGVAAGGSAHAGRADRTGLDQVARIDPENDETPTLGKDRSFLEDLFGNIGQVGAAGVGGGQGGGGGG